MCRLSVALNHRLRLIYYRRFHQRLYLTGVNFNPSVGHEYQGKRPALVIESSRQIKKSNLITVAPLTSNLNNKTFDDIIIKKDSRNKLIKDSVIKVYEISSFDYSRLINRIGAVNQEVMEQIKNYLKKHFDI